MTINASIFVYLCEYLELKERKTKITDFQNIFYKKNSQNF